jgi:phenylpropionate dioxygenase-like ring-hydroxylating dioxygenase large terminal subunit
MIKNPTKVLAHQSAITDKNFVTPDYILNKGTDKVNLFHRYCPHRMYPLAEPGTHTENILCNLHGFEWDKNGIPINNDRKISCGSAQIGKSGLIFKNFIEPDHKWVDILANETDLEYSHACYGASKGSWLWMLDIQADLFHIRKGGVHPGLSEETNLDEVTLDQGDGWVIQYCSTGFWLVIYPYTFVEWSPGCLAVNYTTPNDKNNEFGFTWNTQFYYSPQTSEEKRRQFETLEDVFREDVGVIEKQKGPYFPLMKSVSPLEDHCVHFGKWFDKNKL